MLNPNAAPTWREQINNLLSEVFSADYEPNCSGEPVIDTSFSLNGKDYTLSVPQATKDMLEMTLDAFKKYVENKPPQKVRSFFPSEYQILDDSTAAQKLLDLFLSKFTDNDSAVIFSKLLDNKILELKEPANVYFTNPKAIKATTEYMMFSSIINNSDRESTSDLYRYFSIFDKCDFLPELTLTQNMVDAIYINEPSTLPIMSELFNEANLSHDERIKLAQYMIEFVTLPKERRSKGIIPDPSRIVPLSSPDISRDARIASLALTHHKGGVDLLVLAELVTSLCTKGYFGTGGGFTFNLPASCLSSDGVINLNGLRELYSGSFQEEIDKCVNTIREKNPSSDIFNKLWLVSEGIGLKSFSAEEGLEILQTIAAYNTADEVAWASSNLCYRGMQGDPSRNVVERVVNKFSPKEHLRIYRELREIEDKKFREGNLTIGYINLTAQDLSILNKITVHICDLIKGGDVAVSLAEMLFEATKDQDKATEFKQTIEYLDAITKNDSENQLLQNMLPLIVEDIYQGVDVRYLKEGSIKKYTDKLCKDLTPSQLETINKICSKICDLTKEQTTSELTRYCLAVFVRRGVNTDETLSKLLNFIKSAPSTTISPSNGLKDLNAANLLASIAFEISHPGLICQFGPTCDPTATEYILCTYTPEKYVSFLAKTFNGLCNNPNEYNLTSPERFPFRAELLHYSMHLFQPLLFNERQEFSKQFNRKLNAYIAANIREKPKNEFIKDYISLLADDDYTLRCLNEYGFGVDKIFFQHKVPYEDMCCEYGVEFDEDEYEYELFNHLAEDISEQEQAERSDTLDKIDEALAAGDLIRIAYYSTFTVNALHAAIIMGANYDSDGQVVSYNLYHGYDNASKGGHTETIPREQLLLTLHRAAIISTPEQ